MRIVPTKLVERVAKLANKPKEDVEDIVSMVFIALIQELIENREVEIAGIGKVKIKPFELTISKYKGDILSAIKGHQEVHPAILFALQGETIKAFKELQEPDLKFSY